ncbi:OsmC family protein [Leucobacter musarum]|uniref:OsmC family protein n=1 Tax=Leucobacter musarum TaxID=1930747 RepID=UPI0006A75B99|nr:OsmC family protein [Leucobacter musarum]
MEEQIIVASRLHGSFTDTRGRYALAGDGFEIVSDGSPISGGPGEAASALDLLVASLVSCALNAFRQDLLGDGEEDRRVEIFARVERSIDAKRLGTLVMECFIESTSNASVDPDRLVAEYKRRCRIYNALKDDLPVEFVIHGTDDEPDW